MRLEKTKNEFEKEREEYWKQRLDPWRYCVERDIEAVEAAGGVWKEEEPILGSMSLSVDFCDEHNSFLGIAYGSVERFWGQLKTPDYTTNIPFERRVKIAEEVVRRYNLFPALEGRIRERIREHIKTAVIPGPCVNFCNDLLAMLDRKEEA